MDVLPPPLPAPFPADESLQEFLRDVMFIWPSEFHNLGHMTYFGFCILFFFNLVRLDYNPVVIGIRFFMVALEFLVYWVFGFFNRRRGDRIIRLPQRALANGGLYLGLKYATKQFIGPWLELLGETIGWRILSWLLTFPVLYLELAYQMAAYKAMGFMSISLYVWLTD